MRWPLWPGCFVCGIGSGETCGIDAGTPSPLTGGNSSKNRFPCRRSCSLWRTAIPHPGLWGGAKQQHRKELGGVARSEQVRMAIWAVWQGCWGRDRDADSCGGQLGVSKKCLEDREQRMLGRSGTEADQGARLRVVVPASA